MVSCLDGTSQLPVQLRVEAWGLLPPVPVYRPTNNKQPRPIMANSRYASYGNDSANNSGSGDGDNYDRDLVLKWKPHATFRGVLDSLHAGDNNWGQSLGIKFTDGKLVDGVLMERLGGNGEPDGTLKLFPWDAMPVVLNDDLIADDAPDIYTEEFGGKTYRYQLKAARLEEAKDPAEPIEFGDFIMWESGGDAPSAASKIFAQTLTTLGRDAIVDRNDIFNWLDVNNVELRTDLIGREVDVFKVTKQGDKHEFHSPVVIDVATGSQVMIDNNAGDGGAETPAATATDGGAAAAAVPAEIGASDPETAAIPEPVADFVDFCRDFGLTDEEQILGNLTEMAEEDGNSLTSDMVEQVGEDAILAAIRE